ncbi:hypothetical protein [Roseofilum casamattae]|uniref:Uncharacterized protein n=1 Tax=Roseofilum casamattae BLCC-M143 TaxID=3022442 RepID=A0ABT7BXT4_9CYAN|nr:hypothetical protein [Roseofilum casamattae]MDJ1184004.1 hypothetical protein [Roseofilum casamattae BLCC-M143]
MNKVLSKYQAVAMVKPTDSKHRPVTDTLSRAIFQLNHAKQMYRIEVLDLIERLKKEIDEYHQGGRPGVGITTIPFNEAREAYLKALDVVDEAMNDHRNLSPEMLNSLTEELGID